MVRLVALDLAQLSAGADVRGVVGSFLHPASLLRASTTCRSLHRLLADSTLWTLLVARDFPMSLPLGPGYKGGLGVSVVTGIGKGARLPVPVAVAVSMRKHFYNNRE
jgi:hypothetical protein